MAKKLNLEFRKDKRIFTLFCLLNVCGYDEENNPQRMHPLRIEIRKHLKQTREIDPSTLNLIKKIHRSKLVQWVLHRNKPPSFKKKLKRWYGSIPENEFVSFEDGLKKFYIKNKIGRLWMKYRSNYDLEIKKYKPKTEKMLLNLIKVLHLKRIPKRIILIPNLLDSYKRGTGKKIGQTAYIIFGPSEKEPNLGLIQHEFLHSVIDPLFTKAKIEKIVSEGDSLWPPIEGKMKKLGYYDWKTAVIEHLIRAINILGGYRDLQKQEEQGFLYIKNFLLALKLHKATEAEFEKYLPTILKQAIQGLQSPSQAQSPLQP